MLLRGADPVDEEGREEAPDGTPRPPPELPPAVPFAPPRTAVVERGTEGGLMGRRCGAVALAEGVAGPRDGTVFGCAVAPTLTVRFPATSEDPVASWPLAKRPVEALSAETLRVTRVGAVATVMLLFKDSRGADFNTFHFSSAPTGVATPSAPLRTGITPRAILIGVLPRASRG